LICNSPRKEIFKKGIFDGYCQFKRQETRAERLDWYKVLSTKYQEISQVQVTKSREAKALPTAGRSLREEKK
jgi:hypothetical protein